MYSVHTPFEICQLVNCCSIERHSTHSACSKIIPGKIGASVLKDVLLTLFFCRICRARLTLLSEWTRVNPLSNLTYTQTRAHNEEIIDVGADLGQRFSADAKAQRHSFRGITTIRKHSVVSKWGYVHCRKSKIQERKLNGRRMSANSPRMNSEHIRIKR